MKEGHKENENESRDNVPKSGHAKEASLLNTNPGVLFSLSNGALDIQVSRWSKTSIQNGISTC